MGRRPLSAVGSRRAPAPALLDLVVARSGHQPRPGVEWSREATINPRGGSPVGGGERRESAGPNINHEKPPQQQVVVSPWGVRV